MCGVDVDADLADLGAGRWVRAVPVVGERVDDDLGLVGGGDFVCQVFGHGRSCTPVPDDATVLDVVPPVSVPVPPEREGGAARARELEASKSQSGWGYPAGGGRADARGG